MSGGRAESLNSLTIRRMTGRSSTWMIACVLLAGVVAWGAFALRQQMVLGLGAAGLNDEVSWGLYMVGLIFLMGVGHAGTLISASLRLLEVSWRRPVLRMAELLAVVTVGVGSQLAPLDLGRPERAYFLLLHGRVQSPILWDATAINVYLIGSVLYLYAGMIPDLSVLAGNSTLPRWRTVLYRILSLGYQSGGEDERRVRRAIKALALVLIPVSILAEGVLASVYGSTLRPGWRTTVLAPVFLAGAGVTGTAVLMLSLGALGVLWNAREVIDGRLLHRLGRVLLVLLGVYGYFTLAEYGGDLYHSGAAGRRLIAALLEGGPYAPLFWGTMGAGLVLPIVLLALASPRRAWLSVVAAGLVAVGGMVKRYLLIVPTLETPLVVGSQGPEAAAYSIGWIEVSVLAGAVALIVALVLAFARVFPLIALDEEKSERAQDALPAAAELRRVG